MPKTVCTICGWTYDSTDGYPAGKVAPGTQWDNVPEDFRCPKCGAKKKWFKPMN